MAIIDPPSPFPLSNVDWRLRTPAQVNRSGWTGRAKIIGLPGAQIWLLTANFARISTLAKALPWRGFFLSLHGQAHKFPVRAVYEAQTAAANPTVRIGANAGNTLPLSGLPASATPLVSGMMMTVPLPSGHRRLVGLTADLVTNGAGQGTATFWPELDEVPQAGAAVEIRWPFGLMRLADDTVGWKLGERIQHGFSLNVEEAL
jgi:hypothetical protein